jgi:hypothetical protein
MLQDLAKGGVAINGYHVLGRAKAATELAAVALALGRFFPGQGALGNDVSLSPGGDIEKKIRDIRETTLSSGPAQNVGREPLGTLSCPRKPAIRASLARGTAQEVRAGHNHLSLLLICLFFFLGGEIEYISINTGCVHRCDHADG